MTSSKILEPYHSYRKKSKLLLSQEIQIESIPSKSYFELAVLESCFDELADNDIISAL